MNGLNLFTGIFLSTSTLALEPAPARTVIVIEARIAMTWRREKDEGMILTENFFFPKKDLTEVEYILFLFSFHVTLFNSMYL